MSIQTNVSAAFAYRHLVVLAEVPGGGQARNPAPDDCYFHSTNALSLMPVTVSSNAYRRQTSVWPFRNSRIVQAVMSQA